VLLSAGSGVAQKNPADTLLPEPEGLVPTISSLLPTITPQSPNVAALGRFGEHPVSLFTGLPTIEIPLYDIATGSVQVPVKLSYHAGGNRVTDWASWVGLGWALQAGGQITRSVVGRPDDIGILDVPLNTAIFVPGGDALTCFVSYNALTGYANGTRDSGYDVFSVSAPGLSLRFVLMPDGTGSMATPMPYGRERIDYTRDGFGNISSFTVTATTGTTYLFEQPESVSIGGQNLAYFNAWHLTRIIGTGAQEDIRFSYDQWNGYDSAADWTYSQAVIDNIVGNCGITTGLQAPTQTQLQTFVSPSVLRDITFPGGKVVFVPTDAARTDLPANNNSNKALDRVEVYSWNTGSNGYELVRQFDLQQSYFTPTAGNSYAPLRLNGLTLQEQDGTAIGEYTCTYNTTTGLPDRQSTSRDVWGYYNARANFYAEPAYAQQPTLIPTTTVTLNAPGNPILTVGGANRDPDETAMQAWVLTGLTYPTGGYSNFFFEANRYDDNGTTRLAGGLRITRLETRASASALLQTKTYSYGAGRALNVYPSASSLRQGFWQTAYNTKVSANCTNYDTRVFGSTYNGGLSPFDGSPVVYSQVTEYDGTAAANNGYTNYTFKDLPVDAIYVLGVNPAKNFIVSNSWNRGQLLSKEVYATGGLRMKQVNTYRDDLGSKTLPYAGILTTPKTYFPNGRWYVQTPCQNLQEEFTAPTYYPFITGNSRLTRTEDYTYADDNSGRYTLRTTETDYDATFFQPRETRSFVEGGAVLGTEYTYPQNYGTIGGGAGSAEMLGMLALQNRNVYRPVEEVQFRRETISAAKDYKTGRLTGYAPVTLNGLQTALPLTTYLLESVPGTFATTPYQSSAARYVASGSSSLTLPRDPRYALRLTMTNYDSNGNLTRYDVTDGPATTFSYTGYAPGSGGVPFQLLTQQVQNAEQPNAQTTTYSYALPLLGLDSMTSPRGITTTYSNDAYGRLKTINDKDGNILKQYTYRYATQSNN
jgi:YD repeat-containing protein